jgi:uncharacterized membrane protein
MTPASRRLAVLSLLGVAAGAAVAFAAPWQMAILAGWLAASVAYVADIMVVIARADSARTREISTREDDSRTTRGLLIAGASVMSLGGALLALHKAREPVPAAQTALLTTLAIATVVASWLTINIDFTLRYAHLFYLDPVGGVDFGTTEAPDYRDFAYLSFTIGMTYQVSDTSLLTGRFRRVLLLHAVLSYLFGVVIIATVINISAGFIA